MNNYNFSLESIENTSKQFLDTFDVLKNLEEGEKLFINDNKLFIDQTYSYFQPFKRWLMSQNRTNICDFLKKEFDNYLIFMKMLRVALDTNQNLVEIYKIRIINTKHLEFNRNIINGLQNLMKTYTDFNTAQTELSKIVLFLQKYSVGENNDEVD